LTRSAIRLGELAAEFGCELVGDPQASISRVATLSNAKAGELSFFASKAYRDQLRATSAAAVLLKSADAVDCPVDALITDDPYLVFARIAGLLYPQPAPIAGTHPSATISPAAKIAGSAQISANCVVEGDAVIAANVFVGPGVVIGPRCRIGEASRLLANATIVQDAILGERCIVHPGAIIGSDGFGNAQSNTGWVKVPQVGRVLIGNDVEIGANSTIDRGALDDTIIGDGARLDNMVHIAHNVRIGEHTALAAQNGIAGSTTIGKRCMFGGQVGVSGHLNICDDVIVAGKSVLSKDIREPGYYSNTFAAEKDKEWKRKVARFRRLDNLAGRIKALEKMKRSDDE
jgi:UDP-3-O-[3-hydroxymyristoyl] glucosamine N-acyltransferase